MTTLEQVAKQAQALSPVEKLQLVETILTGLEPVDPEAQKKWAEESDLRFEAFQRGEIEARDWEDVRRDLPK